MKTSNVSADNLKKHAASTIRRPVPLIQSFGIGQRIPSLDSCHLTTTWMRNIKLQAPWRPLLRTGGRKDVRSRDHQKFPGSLETKFGYEACKLPLLLRFCVFASIQSECECLLVFRNFGKFRCSNFLLRITYISESFICMKWMDAITRLSKVF